MKKSMRKVLTVFLSVAVMCAFSIPAFAATCTAGQKSSTTAKTSEATVDETASTDVTSTLGMFKPIVTGAKVKVKSNATVDVTFTTKAMARKYTRIALVTRTKSAAKKDAAAVKATSFQTVAGVDKSGKAITKYRSTFTINIPVTKLGKSLPLSIYQEFPADTGSTGEAGWWDLTSQAYLTVANTPQVVDQLTYQIYYQEKTPYTDTLCAQAKASWDALTSAQKLEVKGFGYYEDTSEVKGGYDYFGLDTGNASADDSGNANGIGSKEILVVSFGTSFNDSRVATIGGVENALEEAFPSYSMRRGFTSQIIINHIQARDGEFIDNIDQAMSRAVANGVKTLVVQPTTLMSGAEYDEMKATISNSKYSKKIQQIVFSTPLCNTDKDKENVAKSVYGAAAVDAGFADADAAKASSDTAFVFMGHGTSHEAQKLYDQMQTVVSGLGYKNCFIGTVEGKPADTSCEAVIAKVKAAGYSKVILRPLMVVAGDHAHNDMAGNDADSWKGQFEAAGFTVSCQIKGLGQLPAVQQMFVNHAKKAMTKVVSPVKTSFSSLKAGKKKVVVKIRKKASMKGYQVRYSLKSSMSGSRIVTISGASRTSKTISKLKSHKRYYLQVRTYVKTANGNTLYSGWSKAGSVKVK
jgi:sirohydrochlorin cobaltochelatase